MKPVVPVLKNVPVTVIQMIVAADAARSRLTAAPETVLLTNRRSVMREQ
jgi:hypothetical protein